MTNFKIPDERIEKLAHRICRRYRHSTESLSRTYEFDEYTLLQFAKAVLEENNHGAITEIETKNECY